MNIELKRGEALFIRGPQGSGKTTLACEIAAKYGRYAVISHRELMSAPGGLRDVLRSRPATVIVDEFQPSLAELNRVKQLLSSPHLTIEMKGVQPISVETPNFIFCTGRLDFLPGEEERRFRVITLSLGH
jgi:ABC-type dipeptide/oligopeptide/nickel transport system ATPase subunit